MKAKAFSLVFVFLAGTCLFAQTEDSTKIFEQNKEGLLSLYVYGGNKDLIAKGVGFGLGSDVIATSYHLVTQAGEVEGVNVKGKKMKVDGIIAADRTMDIALLKVKGKVQILSLGDSDELKAGDRIFALGANEAGDIVVSEGTVRNLHQLAAALSVIEPGISMPQGFCGGPLLNLNGQVIGLLLILDGNARMAIPSNAWKNISKLGKITSFKDAAKEDYFAGYEGAFLGGRIFALLDDLGNAQKYLERAGKINPSNIDLQALLATVYTKQRNYSAAITAFSRVIEVNPNNAEGHFGLGTAYFRMQKWNEAIASLEKAVSLNIANKEVYFTIGSAYEEVRDFAKAAEAYERNLAQQPETAWIGYLRLGFCRMELGQFDQAVAALEEASKAQPRDIKVNYSLAQAYHKAGQLEKAEEAYANLAALNPTDANTYYSQVVKMYDDAGKFENAIAAAKKVIEFNPKSEIPVYNLGIMYYKLKRYDEAIETFKQALAIKPDYDWAYYNLGLCYSFKKMFKESIDAFRNYAALVPDNADAWLNIGVGYMQIKQFENALEPLRKCVEIRPDYGVALFNLAITYLNLKDYYSARDVYKTLVNVDPDLAERLKKYLK